MEITRASHEQIEALRPCQGGNTSPDNRNPNVIEYLPSRVANNEASATAIGIAPIRPRTIEQCARIGPGDLRIATPADHSHPG